MYPDKDFHLAYLWFGIFIEEWKLQRSVPAGALPAWALTSVPMYQPLFISIDKDLFHSVEDGNLNHRILPYSCQLIYSFSNFPQALEKFRRSQAGLEGDAKEKN